MMNENREELLQKLYDAARAMNNIYYLLKVKNDSADRFDVNYLHGKGYIEVFTSSGDYYMSLTLKGIDYVEENLYVRDDLQEYEELKNQLLQIEEENKRKWEQKQAELAKLNEKPKKTWMWWK